MWNRLIFYLFYYTFYILYRLFPTKRVDLNNVNPRRILVFSTAGIGDSLTDSPAIRAIKERFHDAHVTVVAHKKRAIIHMHNLYIDELITHSKGMFIKTLYLLKKRNFDLVVILRANDPDIWPLAWLTNRHAVVSCPVMTRMDFLISHPNIQPDWDYTHGVLQTLRLVETIGAKTDDPRLVYNVREDELEWAYGYMEREGLNGKRLLAFNVGGSRRGGHRDWDYRNFIEVGRKVLDNFDVNILLICGKDNLKKAVLIEKGLNAHSAVKNLAGKLSLSEVAAVLKGCDILLSTDTGIMHLGFAVGGVDVLALIHCMNPASRVGPYGYGYKHQVVQLDGPQGVEEARRISMNDITPEMVYTKLKDMLKRRGLEAKVEPEGKRLPA